MHVNKRFLHHTHYLYLFFHIYSMTSPTFPKLSYDHPDDVREHVAQLSSEINAILGFVAAGEKDTEHRLLQGIADEFGRRMSKGRIEVEGPSSRNINISQEDRALIGEAIVAPSFHKGVLQYLLKTVSTSLNELNRKLPTQQPATQTDRAAEGANPISALGSQIAAQTPPDSAEAESDSTIDVYYGSDTEGVANTEQVREEIIWERRLIKLKAQLEKVEHQRQAVKKELSDKAAEFKKQIREVEHERRVVNQRYLERQKAIEERHREQDITVEYSDPEVGYDVREYRDALHDRRDINTVRVVLRIDNQATVNRLFKMPTSAMIRRVHAAKMSKCSTGQIPSAMRYSSSSFYKLYAYLLDSGDIEFLVANGSLNDLLPLEKISNWDQDILPCQIMNSSEICSVEMKAIEVEGLNISCPKRKAAFITELVRANVSAIPGLHIDHIRNVMPSTNGVAQSLVLDFVDDAKANEALSQGLHWQGQHHECEFFDRTFLQRCGYCQAYGHTTRDCSGPFVCGKCAGCHQTKSCSSDHTSCALCGQSHPCKSPRCPAKQVRKEEKKKLRFPTKKGTEHEYSPAMAIDPTADTLLMSNPQHEDQPAQHSSSVPSFSINIYTGFESAPIADPNIDISRNLPTNNPPSSTEPPTAPLSQGGFQGRISAPPGASSPPYQEIFHGEQKPQLAPPPPLPANQYESPVLQDLSSKELFTSSASRHQTSDTDASFLRQQEALRKDKIKANQDQSSPSLESHTSIQRGAPSLPAPQPAVRPPLADATSRANRAILRPFRVIRPLPKRASLSSARFAKHVKLDQEQPVTSHNHRLSSDEEL